jgi:hypothetical protein
MPLSLSWQIQYIFMKSCKTKHALKTQVDKLKHVKLLTPQQKKLNNNIFPPLFIVSQRGRRGSQRDVVYLG